MTHASPLSTREVYQQLKDVALGIRIMSHACGGLSTVPLGAIESGPVQIEIEHWQLTLYVDGGHLVRCERCSSADGRAASLDDWQRFGSNPVDLLSKWEHEQFERLLRAL